RSGEPDKFIRHFDRASSEKLAGKASRAEKASERLDVVAKPFQGWDLRLEFARTDRPGEQVLAVRDVVVTRAGFTLGPISLDVGPGERIALLGPNGAGKSTLLQIALGAVAPDSGTARRGPSV